MNIEMDAAVLYETSAVRPFTTSRPLVMDRVDLGPLGPGEVLVKVSAAGLCHSDLSAIQGQRPRRLPAVPGHEAAGMVVQVGDAVAGLAVGDQVVAVFVASCGHCTYCVGGRPHLCESSWQAREDGTLLSGARRLRRAVDQLELNHWSGVSAFAEYLIASPKSLVKIDASVPLEVAAVLGCSVVTGVGAVLNTAQVRPGMAVAVFGLGGVGLSAVMGAAVAGAAKIIAVDVEPHKRELAMTVGATHAIDAAADVSRLVKDIAPNGVDFSFEMAGAEASTIAAYDSVARGGSVVMCALPNPSRTFAVPLASHVANERRFVGSYMGGGSAQDAIPRYVDLYRAGRLPIDKLLSAKHSLSDINEGLERLASGKAVRDVVVF